MVNKSIECDVTSCKHHAEVHRYCTLNSINILNNSDHVTASEKCTDCGSFEVKGSCKETP
ncbi:DUF1540 domain-containing protein [Clostridium cylindrosporum]|uniref:DUF1540 domain-containing protein n=1 Tax=Clostridium cylindrosporum DSM 605 TaxID=1121307 RepID=A0A0J8D4V1_CLOCY|nr:DUF1540 domain-containing protein [Clostridium cylindrosporum]KMT21190.1 hypothetical protein CLCY_1c04240 [Clostridium cylindrosporum DSM 605]